jgi:hypothetical protein
MKTGTTDGALGSPESTEDAGDVERVDSKESDDGIESTGEGDDGGIGDIDVACKLSKSKCKRGRDEGGWNI